MWNSWWIPKTPSLSFHSFPYSTLYCRYDMRYESEVLHVHVNDIHHVYTSSFLFCLCSWNHSESTTRESSEAQEFWVLHVKLRSLPVSSFIPECVFYLNRHVMCVHSLHFLFFLNTPSHTIRVNKWQPRIPILLENRKLSQYDCQRQGPRWEILQLGSLTQLSRIKRQNKD